MAAPLQLVEVLERFAATMADVFDVNDVLYELGDSTVRVLDAAGAGVSVSNPQDQLLFITATSAAVIEIERSQEQEQAGPCVEAFRTGELVVVDDIATLTQWPDYQRAAARGGFQAVVGLPLQVGAHKFGSLNVYDRRQRQWDDTELRAARVLADIATAYIVRSGELAEARELSTQLQVALDSRIIIEQAKGMLAREHQVSVDEAFELLRKHARSNSIALRRVADAVVNLSVQLPRS